MKRIAALLTAVLMLFASCADNPNGDGTGALSVTFHTVAARTLIPELPEAERYRITLTPEEGEALVFTTEDSSTSLTIKSIPIGIYDVEAEGLVGERTVLRNTTEESIQIKPNAESSCIIILSFSEEEGETGSLSVDITWNGNAITNGPFRDALDSGKLGFLAISGETGEALTESSSIQWIPSEDINKGSYTYLEDGIPLTRGTRVAFQIYTGSEEQPVLIATTFDSFMQIYGNITSSPDANEANNFNIGDSVIISYLKNVTEASAVPGEDNPETSLLVSWTNPLFSADLYPYTVNLTLEEENGSHSDSYGYTVSSREDEREASHVFTDLSKDSSYSVSFQIIAKEGYSAERTMITGARPKTPVESIAITGLDSTYTMGDSPEVKVTFTPSNATYQGYEVSVDKSEGVTVNGHEVIFNTHGEYTITATSTDNPDAKATAKVYVNFSTPQNFKAEAVESGIQLTWDAVSGADKYVINKTVVSGKGESREIPVTNGTSYLDTDVYSSSEYSYTVKATTAESDAYDSISAGPATITTKKADITISIEDIDRPEVQMEIGKFIIDGKAESSFTVSVNEIEGLEGATYQWLLNGDALTEPAAYSHSVEAVTINGTTEGLENNSDEDQNTLVLVITSGSRKYSATAYFYVLSSDPGTITLSDAGDDRTVTYSSAENRSEALSISFSGNPSFEPNIKWESNAPEIISVDESGTVTSHKDGKATITATISSTGESASIELTSYIKAASISFSDTIPTDKFIIEKGGVEVLSDIYNGYDLSNYLTVTAANGDKVSGTVTWSSSADDVLSVSNGQLSIHKAGTATITAEIDGMKAERTFNVIDFDIYRDDASNESNKITGSESTFTGGGFIDGLISPNKYSIFIKTANGSIDISELNEYSTTWCLNGNPTETIGKDVVNGNAIRVSNTDTFSGQIERAAKTGSWKVTILLYDESATHVATISFTAKS